MRTKEELSIIKEYLLEQRENISNEIENINSLNIPGYAISIIIHKLNERRSLLWHLTKEVMNEVEKLKQANGK